MRIEKLEKEWARMARSENATENKVLNVLILSGSSQQFGPPPVIAPPPAAGPTINNVPHNHVNGITPSSPSPESEQQYDEKTAMLGYRRPSPPHPLASLSFRDLFKAILEHAAECRLPECRLDNSKYFTISFHFFNLPFLVRHMFVLRNNNTDTSYG